MKPEWTRLCFWSLLFGMAAVLELLTGTVGWIFPLVSAVFFCFALQCAWQHAAFTAILTGMLLDLATGRSFPVSIAALAAMLPAVYRMRPAELTTPADLITTAAVSAASAEAVYTLAAWDFAPSQIMQWGILTVQNTLLTLLTLWFVHFWTDCLKIPNGFMPRSVLWKKNRRNMTRLRE